MEKILTKQNFRKFETWLLTLGFGFFLFSMLIIARGAKNFKPWRFTEHNIQYNYFENSFLPILIQGITVYVALMLMVLVAEPLWERTRSLLKTGAVVAGTALITALIIAITDTYQEAWRFAQYRTVQAAYNHIFFDAFMLIAAFTIGYIAYYLIKQLTAFLFSNIDWKLPSSKNLVNKIILGIIGYVLLAMFFAAANLPNIMIVGWLVAVPYSAFVIAINVRWLIPSSPVRNFFSATYLWRLITITLPLATFAAFLIGAGVNAREDEIAVLFMLLIMWTAVALLPWAWYLFKQSADKTTLVTALGQSDASLSFLRSQINPHFLFNALNTLYGTALQENAERTGEGIQKLGDMMRFMLQENVQDRISLTRDVDYLNNYIDLQKLRTARSPEIVIETQIEEQLNNLDIAPMLLIPFVENAFKHGISLQHPSHIKVTLQTRESTLYFDVHNSIHIKAENDPEKLKSGIGLENVKQRLNLLYPGRHELIIRESAKEFFIHLTLQLQP